MHEYVHGLKNDFLSMQFWARKKFDLPVEAKGAEGLRRVWHGTCNTWIKKLNDSVGN